MKLVIFGKLSRHVPNSGVATQWTTKSKNGFVAIENAALVAALVFLWFLGGK